MYMYSNYMYSSYYIHVLTCTVVLYTYMYMYSNYIYSSYYNYTCTYMYMQWFYIRTCTRSLITCTVVTIYMYLHVQ